MDLSDPLNKDTQPLLRVAILIATLAAAVVIFIGPLLDLLQGFGVPISDDQINLIVTFIQSLTGIAAPLGVAVAAWPKVTPWNPESGAQSPVGDQVIDGGGSGEG